MNVELASMITQVILHIGLHHTGTTSFQTFLHKNRTKLQSQFVSVYQPVNKGVNAAELCAAAKLRRGSDHYESVKQAVHNQCNDSRARILVVSAECLWAIDAESDLRRLRSLFPAESSNFKIVLVRRDAEVWARRHWKIPDDENVNEEEVRAVWARSIDLYKSVFGDVRLLAYEKSGMVEALCDTCGIDVAGLKVDYSYHRTSKAKVFTKKWFPGFLRFYSRYLARSIVGHAKRKFFNE